LWCVHTTFSIEKQKKWIFGEAKTIHVHAGGTIDFRSKCLEPTVGCFFKIENFGLENATTPLKTQYRKEWSSKICGADFFFPLLQSLLFPPGLLRQASVLKAYWRSPGKKARIAKGKNPVPLILLDHSFPYCLFKGGVAYSNPKFSILKMQLTMGSRHFDLKSIVPPVTAH